MSPTSPSFGSKTLDNRHVVRQIIVQNLYTRDFADNHKEFDIQKELEIDPDKLDLEYISSKLKKRIDKSMEYIKDVTSQIESISAELDQIVSEYAPEWPLNQINRLDLQIMRLALYEGFVVTQIPEKVAIDEAIELAKDFGLENNVKFVSGVLGKIFSFKDTINWNIIKEKLTTN